jgi:hypothetical protein
MRDDYTGSAVLRPDLLMEDCQNRIVELHDALFRAFVAIEALIDDKPMLAAKVCGTTTLGNVRAEIKAVLQRGEIK